MKHLRLHKVGALTLACSAMFFSTLWAASTNVAILPFQINAEKDYTFLQKGIVEMLTSRLSSETVSVVDPTATAKAVESVKGMSGDSRALMVGAKLQADYIIHGSITVLGESVSIDAKMLNVTGTQAPFHFSEQTASMNEVIPQINRLATDINGSVFNRRPAGVVPLPPTPETPQGETRPAIHAHPDKLLQSARTMGDDAPPGANPTGPKNPPNPAFESTTTQGIGSKGDEFWKSRNFNFLINGMDVGDVNNDGLLETVLVAPDKIHIYQFSQTSMRKIAEIETGGNYNIGADVGDINGNGTPEIFVTSLNSRHTTLASQVLEFDGQGFKPIIKSAPWYFRIVQHPLRGPILLGQRQKYSADPLSSPIFEMTWQSPEYIQATRVLPAGKANVLGVSYGDIRDDQNETVVAYSASEKLRLYGLNGHEIWTSSEYFGGSPMNIAMPPEGPGDTERPFYLPTRTRPVDLDDNQKAEILVAQNGDSSNRKLSRQRFYTSARIMTLTWDGLGLTPVWQTRKISGRVQDLGVADFDNDGKKELLAAVISKEGAFIGTKAQSALIAYDLNQ